MCGFFGIYYFKGEAKETRDQVSDILDTIRHRGPDDHGYFEDKTIRLGFNRLSILDLSPSGHQPMSNETGDHHLVFNGEIFNYLELKDELKNKGHRFSSTSDTEVILKAYEEYGVECLPHFNGMWGFTLYDARKKRLFCSRDRFGIKPFYYFVDEEKIIVASEIKAILKAGVKAEVDEGQVFKYLAYGQLDIDEKTMFKNIFQLPPAHFMVLENGNIKISKFWQLKDEKSFDLPVECNREILSNFSELFNSAINIRLRSDVPVGALLSGGLDSSAIVSVINQIKKEKGLPLDIKTFTASYDEKAIDESHFAADVVRETGINNILVYPGSKGDLSSEVEKVIYHQDEPPLTMTAFAHWYLMKEISKHNIKVIISGQGADEMLAGYVEQFLGYFLKDLLLSHSYGNFFREIQSFNEKSKISYPLILMQLIKATMSRRIALIFKSFLRERAIQHLNFDFVKKNWRSYHYSPDMKNYSKLNQQLHRTFVMESIPRILHYEDRNSMAFSIEQRMPFLDYRLVEFIFGLTNSWKMGDGVAKIILRKALKGVMPDTITNRYSKLGFTVPQNRWIQEVEGYVSDLFSSASFRQRPYWDSKKIKNLYTKNMGSQAKMDIFLWRVIACETWLNKYF